MHRFVAGLGLIMVWLLSLEGKANHIIGGDISMQAIGTTPGLFTIKLNQYWDATQSSVGNQDPTVTLLVYRKNNPVLVERITLLLREKVPLTFENAACANLRQLSFIQGTYYADYQFNTSLYTDAGGYYMVWERCCLSDAITNVSSPLITHTAMAFYIEFPSMLKGGVNFTNSSPDFRLPNGAYICLNKPFTFAVSATDVDGDQLRYSLVTPLNGYTTFDSPTVTDESPRSSYPPINWKTGYGVNNVIPGNPPLRVDPATGLLSVQATEVGLYLFTVLCEEFRNGVRIGSVRREFQLPVVDCSKNTPPPAVITANGKVSTYVAWCASQPLVLSVDRNPLWAYQWQKDGNNLRGSIADTLQVRTPGVYTVVKSLANQCANDTASQAVKVDFVTAPPVALMLANAKPYCTGDTLTIQAAGQANYQYRWQRDGQLVPGEEKATLRVYQSGVYQVLARPVMALCDGQDSVRVVINPRPAAQIKPSSLTFCPDESVPLTAQDGVGNRYRWTLNGSTLSDTASQVVARQGGTYQVTVTGATGCSAVSPGVLLTAAVRPLIQLDSIAPICISNATAVTLTGQPVGGTYTGAGVQGNLFDPVTAGVGRHQLTYTVTSDKGCRAEKSQWIAVQDSPRLTGSTTYFLVRGKSVQLVTQASEPVSRYQWAPPESLDRADIASPMASPNETTPYTLTAVNAAGCPAFLSILVDVTDILSIPSAFSPNSDGLNDSWVISNIRLFPDANVFIYNRWGELIFFSQGYTAPWDGTYRQERVPPGLYTYQIRTGNGPQDTVYRGQLMVIH